MAAGLLQRDYPGWQVSSAGLAAPVGAAADPRAVRMLAREGCDIGRHRARTVDATLLAAADVVLVMEARQRDTLEEMYPEARGKTYRLCEFMDADVPDPYGCSQKMFELVLELIRQGIASWAPQLEAHGRTERQGAENESHTYPR